MTTDREERRRARLEERRRTRGRQKRAKRRIRPALALVLGGVVVVGVLGFGGARLLAGDDATAPARAVATRKGSEEATGATGRVTIERTPASYRVVYRLEEFTGPKVALSTDKVWVRRPFESRLETWRGAPPGDKLLSSQVGAFARRRNESSSAEAVVLAVPPSSAPSDVRLLPALADAEAGGLLQAREVRVVLDRRCQVYRSGQLLSGLSLTKPSEHQYTDSCVDAAGIVLEELFVVDGETLSRRIAVEVEEEPSLDGRLFETGPRTLAVADGGGLVRRMGEGLPPGEFLLVDPATIPAGFERLGRFNVIPSQPENFSDPTREGARETSFADVYVRGADFLVIDQGGTLQGVDPFTEDPGSPRLDLGPYGSGELRLSALGVEVRAKRTGGRFVRVRGTVDADDLASVAKSLAPTEGSGPLEFLEEPGAG
ncbi:MAG TPA: hypothetical protein VM143_04060 [Acidimicrobiales bacterium]|nr:hypothetical protein [Acidimicrobiales bacterium]